MSRGQHIFHVWLNKQETHGKDSPTHELNPLYVWKDAMSFREHGHHRIKQAFDGSLPKTHRQCSRSPVQPVTGNKLTCCLGREVVSCPYVTALRAEFERHWNMPVVESSGYDPGKFYRAEVSEEDMFKSIADLCAAHVFIQVTNAQAEGGFIDYTEGFHLDETDRMFWDGVYRSLSSDDTQAKPQAEPGTTQHKEG